MPAPLVPLSTLTGTTFPEAPESVLLCTDDLRRMPPTHQAQLRFLDPVSTQAVYDAANARDILSGDDGWGNTPFTGGRYRSVEQTGWSGAARKKWLYGRGVPFRSDALVLPVFAAADEPALLTTWKLVVVHSELLFDGDNVVVVGETAEWCLYWHHDGATTFARDIAWERRAPGQRW